MYKRQVADKVAAEQPSTDQPTEAEQPEHSAENEPADSDIKLKEKMCIRDRFTMLIPSCPYMRQL